MPLGVSLRVPSDLFRETMAELRNRSSGWRESAAIWAGTVSEGQWTAKVARFHHRLCDDSGAPLFLELTEAAKFSLYSELETMGLRLVALIHTHPKDWVGLSAVDQANQICSRRGFWSIVAPRYGQEPWDTARFGVHSRIEDGCMN
jgi:proteasome lid subunit RPN8/RPN11